MLRWWHEKKNIKRSKLGLCVGRVKKAVLLLVIAWHINKENAMCSCLPINKTLKCFFSFFFPGFLRAPHKYFCISYAQQYVSSTALFTKTNDYCKLIYLVDSFLNITIILNCLYVLKSFFIPFLLFSICQVGSLKKLLNSCPICWSWGIF